MPIGPISIGVEVQRNTDGDTPSKVSKKKSNLLVDAFIDHSLLYSPLQWWYDIQVEKEEEKCLVSCRITFNSTKTDKTIKTKHRRL